MIRDRKGESEVEIIALLIFLLLIVIARNIKAGFQIVEKQLRMINENLNDKKE